MNDSKVEKNYSQIIMQLNWWLGLSGRWYGLALEILGTISETHIFLVIRK
jgi:hypothetical protein